MKDIDNQEIQIGDVVMIVSGIYSGRVDGVDMSFTTVTDIKPLNENSSVEKVYCRDNRKRGKILTFPHEIFCLFYRKPTKE